MTTVALTSGGTTTYSYGPDNRKVWTKSSSGSEGLVLYGAMGELLTYIGETGATHTMGPAYVYFAGKRIWSTENSPIFTDRRGTTMGNSLSLLYPYGESTGSDFSFATYERSSATGLDYAHNRYYSSTLARFTTADPYRGSMNPENPSSFNRYSYVTSDPVNRNDPDGLEGPPLTGCVVNGMWAPDCPSIHVGHTGAPADPDCGGRKQTQFVANYLLDAQRLSHEAVSGALSPGLILAMSAIETSWGTSDIAINNNDFFNISDGHTTPDPDVKARFPEAVACSSLPDFERPNANRACYPIVDGFYLSGEDAFFAPHNPGNWSAPIQGSPTINAASVASSTILLNPNATVGDIAQAIANAGFCKTSDCVNGQYGNAVQSVYNQIQKIANCMGLGPI